MYRKKTNFKILWHKIIRHTNWCLFPSRTSFILVFIYYAKCCVPHKTMFREFVLQKKPFHAKQKLLRDIVSGFLCQKNEHSWQAMQLNGSIGSDVWLFSKCFWTVTFRNLIKQFIFNCYQTFFSKYYQTVSLPNHIKMFLFQISAGVFIFSVRCLLHVQRFLNFPRTENQSIKN